VRTVDLIARKRDGDELADDEIGFLVAGYTRGEIPDYQMAAFLMAVVLNPLNQRETVALTDAMIRSGEVIDLQEIDRYKVDKHSTGGVGDKVTLVLAPVLASLGLSVPKLSGRGLGHTGGTLDKLESIAGFRTDLDSREFRRIASEVGVAVAGPTQNLVPADQKMYALRDVTATVESVPLIAASILSKKLAVETDALVIDVKVGDGAFFRTLEQAERFSELVAAVGRALGREVATVQTGMEQPLGRLVGNALEVKEAVATLRGRGPEDLVEVVLALAARLLTSSGDYDLRSGRDRARRSLEGGEAWRAFVRWIGAQGGDVGRVEDPSLLPRAARQIQVAAVEAGWVRTVKARAVGELAMELGAGRARKDDEVDPAAGVELAAKVGDRVERGQLIGVLHSNRLVEEGSMAARLLGAVQLSEEEVSPAPTVLRP
jgi:pyrimidine-nucleoside phosphorylase